MITEAVWHDDGHVMHLELNKSEVVITTVSCPHTGKCHTSEADYIVEWFLLRYGLDVNVGICEAAAEVQIAWSVLGDTRSVDTCQVWVIPSNDQLFNAWAEAERQSSSSTG